jgi:hypothetical protein
MRAILSIAAVLLAGAAVAAPRTIDDCEAIKEPDLYNRCLASFGPVRGGGGGKYYRPASEAKHGAKRHRAGYASSSLAQRTRSGRVRMEFTPGRGR